MLTEAQAKKSKFFTTQADPNNFSYFFIGFNCKRLCFRNFVTESACGMSTICKNIRNEQVTPTLDKERFSQEKTIYHFHLVRQLSSSKLLYYRTNFCLSVTRLFYSKLNGRKRGNSLSVFHRNSPKYSNDQRGN